VERRLAAILTADVVAYSRLMGKDEGGTLAALRRHRVNLIEPKAARHHGRVTRLMGDGALMEFVSVIDAVVFALEVQLAMRDNNRDLPEDRALRFRIGINIGDVIVDGSDIYGDGVNVGARLEGLAEPGGICISRNVRDQIRDKLDVNLEDMGEVEVKNITRPVRAFRIVLNEKAQALVSSLDTLQPKPAHRRRWLLAAAGFVALAATAGTAAWYAVPVLRQDPVVAVPTMGWIALRSAEGDVEFTEAAFMLDNHLLAELSRSTHIAVVDTSGEQAEVVKTAGYLLEGTVNEGGGQVTLSIKLVGEGAVRPLWSESYDIHPDELGASDDPGNRMILEIAGALLAHATAEQETGRALAALYWRCWLHRCGEGRHLGLSTWGDAWDRAEHHLELAMESPTSLAHQVASWMLLQEGRYDEALAEAKRAVALDPSDADAIASLAEVRIISGAPLKALTELQRVQGTDLERSPLYPRALGRVLFATGRFPEAVAPLERAAALLPGDKAARELLTATYGHLGRTDDAAASVAALLELVRHYWDDPSVTYRIHMAEFESANQLPGARSLLLDGLRLAGVPE
jgi:adenylate cyclase